MNAHPNAQVEACLPSQPGIQLPERVHDGQPCPDGALGIVLMGSGIAKVDEQPIAQVLRNMALKALDHLGAAGLIGPHHVAPLFGIEPAGEHG